MKPTLVKSSKDHADTIKALRAAQQAVYYLDTIARELGKIDIESADETDKMNMREILLNTAAEAANVGLDAIEAIAHGRADLKEGEDPEAWVKAYKAFRG